MNGIESPILSYSDPIQFSQVPLSEEKTCPGKRQFCLNLGKLKK